MRASRRDRCYIPRLQLLCPLPHEQPTTTEHSHRHGGTTVAISCPSSVGLPYGREARVVLAWLTGEALRAEARELMVEEGLFDFAQRAGFGRSTDGPRQRRAALQNQLRRLLSTTVTVTTDEGDYWRSHGFRIAKRAHLTWREGDTSEWPTPASSILLGRAAFDYLVTRAIPLDLRVIRCIRAPFAIDVYAWLVDHARSLGQPTVIAWTDLRSELGAGFERFADFRQRLTHCVEGLRRRYPNLVTVTPVGLEIRPMPAGTSTQQ